VGGQRQALHDEHPEVRARAVAELARSGDPRVLHDLLDALADQDAGVREAAAAAVGQIGGRSAIPVLRQHLGHKDEDPWVRLRLAESLASLGERDGLATLLDLAATGDGGLLRLEALNSLSRFASMAPPVDDPASDAAQKRLAALRDWWTKDAARLHFDPQTRTFR
jgi:HEAT repeat protein